MEKPIYSKLSWLLLALLTLGITLAIGQQRPAERTITLAWDPSPDTNVVGYWLYYGRASGNYTNKVYCSCLTNSVTVFVPPRIYFAVTAVDSTGLESDFSNEDSYDLPPPPPDAVALMWEYTTNFTDWHYGGFITNEPLALPQKFYRLKAVPVVIQQ